jgi:hypothetical protein
MSATDAAPAMNTPQLEPPAPAPIVAVVPARLATSCPRCGALKMCCKGRGSAAPGEPADHQGVDA